MTNCMTCHRYHELRSLRTAVQRFEDGSEIAALIAAHDTDQRRIEKLKADIARISAELLELSFLLRRLISPISDASWSEFVSMLRYKAERYGRAVQFVDRFFPSSQMCSCCGCISPITKDPSVREWDCPECGAHHDRDINSAVNIRRERLRMLYA